MKLFSNKGPTNFLILLALIVCLVALSIFGIQQMFFKVAVYEIPSIPYPQDSTKLPFSIGDFKTQVNQKPALLNLKAEALKIKGQNAEQVFEKYKVQLEQEGWSLAHQESWYYFRKGSKSIALSTTPEDEQNLDYLAKISPNLQKRLELNDILMIIVHGYYEDLLHLEY